MSDRSPGRYGGPRRQAGDAEIAAFLAVVLGAASLVVVAFIYHGLLARHGIPLTPVTAIPVVWLLVFLLIRAEKRLQARSDWLRLKSRWYWFGSVCIPGLAFVLPVMLAILVPWPVANEIPSGLAAVILVLPAAILVVLGFWRPWLKTRIRRGYS